MDPVSTSLATSGASTSPIAAGNSAPGGTAQSASAPGAHVQSTPRSTPEQRAAWRAKRAKAQARKAGAGTGAPSATPGERSPAPVPASTTVSPGASPVLWTPATLRPLLEQVVPVAEAIAVEQLKDEAKKISTEACSLVATKGRWNSVAVVTLKEGGAAAVAKWMNAAGISAEYAPEVQVGIALCSIVAGHFMLLQELRAMAEEKKKTIKIQATVHPQKPKETTNGSETKT